MSSQYYRIIRISFECYLNEFLVLSYHSNVFLWFWLYHLNEFFCHSNESLKDPNSLCFVSSSIWMRFPVIRMTRVYSIHSFKWGTVAFECVPFYPFKCLRITKFIRMNLWVIRMALVCKSLTPNFPYITSSSVTNIQETPKLNMLRWE